MILDFKDIPAGNKGGDGQDQFELFGRYFLKAIGFKIIQHPNRGADRKKDMIVFGKFEGTNDIQWLVSCKHNAHSKSRHAVNEIDEPNIIDRLRINKCKGFIGIYSTIATSNLSNNLYDLKDDLISEIFDHRRIEDYIFQKVERHHLACRYFENSYNKHKDKFFNKQLSENMKTVKNNVILSEEDVLRICKTALIIIEIGRIKEKFFKLNWDKRADVLDELYQYSEHTNIKIANAVYSFLLDVVDATRSGITTKVALSVFSLTIDFFPYSEKRKDKKEIIELGYQCINIGYNIIYDSTIHRKDYNVTMYGLTILKYIYKKGKQQKLKPLTEKVNETYKEIEQVLLRQDRPDKGDSLQLVLEFKADIEERSLSFPMLSDNLMKLIYPDEKK
ncbi:MAG: hypothetical protein WCP69_13090 [Bacteroidota bacterium]